MRKVSLCIVLAGITLLSAAALAPAPECLGQWQRAVVSPEDFLVQTSNATVDMLKRRQFEVVWRESAGGRTWINWRNYLHKFTPLLFVEK